MNKPISEAELGALWLQMAKMEGHRKSHPKSIDNPGNSRDVNVHERLRAVLPEVWNGIPEIAAILGIKKSSAARYLSTMAKLGLAERKEAPHNTPNNIRVLYRKAQGVE